MVVLVIPSLQLKSCLPIAGVPELSANRMGYGLGFSSNIMLSDRASLSLGWKYIGTIGKSSPYEPINAYLVEIGTKLYF